MDQGSRQPRDARLGGVLPEPLAARQGGPPHPRRELHRRLLLEHLRQGRRSSPGRCRPSTTRCSTASLPPYEPRGCQRGISFSWYLYSPLRVKYPYLRGVLIDLWREARKAARRSGRRVGVDPVDDPEKRAQLPAGPRQGRIPPGEARDEVLELIAASTVYTVKKHGPDRIIGFSPIPAMSHAQLRGRRALPAAPGRREPLLLRLVLRPATASPEVWGEQTDVAESADWYHSKFIASMGSNLSMTRTPDVPLRRRGPPQRHQAGGALARLLAGLQVRRPVDPRQRRPGRRLLDGGGPRHPEGVLPRDRPTPDFRDYVRRYSDAPFLVELEERDGGHRPGRMLRAGKLARTRDEENGEWKFLVCGRERRAPHAAGQRWASAGSTRRGSGTSS